MVVVAGDAQREAIAFLEERTRERVDTHAAIVFLAQDRAYKLKRAVRFSYLDFSTPERREQACRAEVALNRRTVPDLYLGVRSMTRGRDGRLDFDGAGEVVDWIVEMRRFDQALLFDRLAERGELTEALMESLSSEIARFHAAAEVTPGMGGRASFATEIEGNEQNFAQATALGPELCTSLVERWQKELGRDGEMLDRRDAGGRVRRCHGDLHLRNIFLWHGVPALFDCIEFSEHLSCIDVLYDLAFLLMDLEHRGLRALANLVCNGYLDRNDETDGLAALPFMMSLRAGIRAHTGVAAAHTQPHPERRQAIIDEARSYLDLAARLLERRQPQLVAIGGLSGTGKSTLTRAFAPECGPVPGARTLHTDALRKRMFGVEKTERLGPQAYTPEIDERVYRSQREAAAASLRAGYSAIVDGVFSKPEERAAIAAIARTCNVPFTGLWLVAPSEVVRARVAARKNDMSDAGLDVLEDQLGRDSGEVEWQRLEAGGSVARTLDDVRAATAAGLAR
ncbi:MAG TPA: AAA family ATPase [Candidatus Acidoferrales bacterium]|nr:AAA family ATPase [Candidatus Acidoferrales bacterium]